MPHKTAPAQSAPLCRRSKPTSKAISLRNIINYEPGTTGGLSASASLEATGRGRCANHHPTRTADTVPRLRRHGSPLRKYGSPPRKHGGPPPQRWGTRRSTITPQQTAIQTVRPTIPSPGTTGSLPASASLEGVPKLRHYQTQRRAGRSFASRRKVDLPQPYIHPSTENRAPDTVLPPPTHPKASPVPSSSQSTTLARACSS